MYKGTKNIQKVELIVNDWLSLRVQQRARMTSIALTSIKPACYINIFHIWVRLSKWNRETRGQALNIVAAVLGSIRTCSTEVWMKYKRNPSARKLSSDTPDNWYVIHHRYPQLNTCLVSFNTSQESVYPVSFLKYIQIQLTRRQRMCGNLLLPFLLWTCQIHFCVSLHLPQ